MKPVQLIMEGILPVEQQVMSRITKALNFRKMMDRLAAQAPKAPPVAKLPDVQATPEEIAKGFQDIRSKIAAAPVQPPPQQAPQVKPGATFQGMMQILLGKQIADFASPYARGKDVAWHGSNPANYAAIKQEGIKTMGEMAERGKTMIGHVLTPEAQEASKNMAFVTRGLSGRGMAATYQAQAQLPRSIMDIGPRPDLTHLHSSDLEASRRTLRELSEYSRRLGAATAEREMRAPLVMLKDLLTGKRPLQIEFPHQQGPGFVTNPEIAAIRQAEAAGNPVINGEKALKGLASQPGVEGGVASEFIRGGKGFRWLSGTGIKKAPLRALAGLLGVSGGIGLAGLGAFGINKNLVQPLLEKKSHMNTATKFYLAGLIKLGEYQESEPSSTPNVDAMLKGISKVPACVRGNDTTTTEKVATLDKQASEAPGYFNNLSELKKLVAMASENPEKIRPAEDVLQDKSMTVPFGVVRGAAGAAGGAVAGNLLSRLVTGPIDPNASERTAREIRKKRNLGAGIGGALGLYLASRKELQDPDLLKSLRQRFAV
jgi:hypothetical protein